MGTTRRASTAALAVGVSLAAMCGCGTTRTVSAPAPATTVTPTPAPAPAVPAAAAAGGAASLLAAALHHASAMRWCSVVATLRGGGQRIVIVQEVGTARGAQRISEGGRQAEVVVVPGATYITGAASPVTDLPDRAVLDHHWVRLRPGDGDYAGATDGILMSSVLAQSTPAGPLTLVGPRLLDGTEVIGIAGHDAGPDSGHARSVLYVSVGDLLPAEEVVTGRTTGVTERFTRWGVPATVAAPRSWITDPTVAAPA